MRVQPEPHLMGEELEHFLERNLQPKIKRLDELMQPRLGDMLAYNEARRLFDWHNRFEGRHLPRDGGWQEQTTHWIMVMECALTAQQRAQSLKQREDAWEQKERSNQARNEAAAANTGSAPPTT